MYRLAALVLLAGSGFLADAQQILTFQKPDPAKIPLTVELKKSVVNIQANCRHGDTQETENGTGFIVGYTDSRLQAGQSFQYLITNRHVAECWDDNKAPSQMIFMTFRENLKNGQSRRVAIDSRQWKFPADSSVDLAAMPILMDPDVSTLVIPIEAFATKDFLYQNQIVEGSRIMLAGYFYQIPGEKQFESILREGIISMVPDEPIVTTTGKFGSVYLCEVHIFGGNSGSPVMVAADALAINGYRLLGVVSGYYYEDSDFNLEIAMTVKGKQHANSGIALVIPATDIRELLDAPELKIVREAYFATHPMAAKP